MIALSKRVGVVGVLTTVVLLAAMNLTDAGQAKKGGDTAKSTQTAKGPAGLTFEVYKDKGGEFRYRILDETGANLGGSGKGYDKKEDLLKVVNAIKKGAATAKVDDKAKDDKSTKK